MAKPTFIKSARKDIYTRGKLVELFHQKGKNAGQKYMKRDRTQPEDENDTILIHKGESYWTWAFMNQPPRYSRTRPRASQLTNSEFMSAYYGIMEQIEDWEPEDHDQSTLESFVEDIRSQVEDLRDETQDRLDNMPEQLQESDSGQLLQERIDECDRIVSDLDSIDTSFDYDENDLEDEKEQAWEDKVQEIKDISFEL